MLVLSRKLSEKIIVDELIEITIVRIGPGAVRIGISAPAHMDIRREEIAPKAVPSQIPVIDGSDPDALAAMAGV